MGYYVSNMIGIRTGGVFSNGCDMDDLKKRIVKIIAEMKNTEFEPDIDDDLRCMSPELTAHKGNYVVIAGVFNYWIYKWASEFCRKISKEFCTEVMFMCWDEEEDSVQCQIFLDGKPLFENNECPIGKILRRSS